MTIPNPIRLFHITAIENLPNIFARQALLSKNSVASAGATYTNIAHQGAQGARSSRQAPTPPGGTIHDYVPFYFAPRSPMLYAINGGKVQGCDLRQSDIVHFETTVNQAIAHGEGYVFYDRNATLAYSNPYTDLQHLNAVAWDLITEQPQLDGYCKFWHSVSSNQRYVDRMERRMAEFLVKNTVPLSALTKIGVIDAARKAEVEVIMSGFALNIPVRVMPSWYF